MQGLTVTPEGNFLGIQALVIPSLPFQRDPASSVGNISGSPALQPLLSAIHSRDLSSPAGFIPLPAAGETPCWTLSPFPAGPPAPALPDPRDLGLDKSSGTDKGGSRRAQTQSSELCGSCCCSSRNFPKSSFFFLPSFPALIHLPLFYPNLSGSSEFSTLRVPREGMNFTF